jgi:hypothetical protein
MPSNSSATIANCACCAAGSAGSSATSAARLKDVPNSRRPSKRRWRALRRSDRNSSASADGSSIPSTPPEVECIGKGKARAPYEFGVKASIVTTNARAPGGQFVLHATALKPSATAYCTFFQGANLIQNGLSFGDGIRCAGVPLKRLYFKHAPSGFADAPTGSDPSILNRSAALGDVIGPGSTRWYQVTYRDPANFACGVPSTFNSTV